MTDWLNHYKNELSVQKYVLFMWMCVHVANGGTPTSNPHPGDVFGYLYHLLRRGRVPYGQNGVDLSFSLCFAC